MKNILIAGGTGFLGWNITKELLKDKCNIYLLVRTKDKKSPQQRIRALISKDFKKNHIRDIKKRLRIVEGDIVEPRLGIEKAKRKELVKIIDTIYHCAALCDLGASLKKNRKINVEGTKNTLEFAEECQEGGQFRCFNHISTAGVAGDFHGIFYENFLDKGQGFNNTYEQSKFEAEKLAQGYKKQGLPTAIFRPSVITGDSITGEVNNFQMLYQFLHILSLELFEELPINKTVRYGLVPVDYVAKAISLVSSNDYNNKTYHLVNPNTISFNLFLDVAVDYFGFRRPSLVSEQTYNYEKLTGFRKSLIDLYLPYLIHKRILFDARNFESAVDSKGFSWPKVDEKFLIRLFRYCDKIGYIKRKR